MRTPPLATTAELFAGIGGFRLAADAAGLRTVFANDVCSLASSVYRSRFGGAGYVEGDLGELLDGVPPHDLLTGGFPCQPFSSAGKKLGHGDQRTTAFQLLVQVLEQRQPRAFVLENVKRLLTMEQGSHFSKVLASLASAGYSVEWRVVNVSNLGLAQNRQRVILLGTRDGDEVAARLVDDKQLAPRMASLEWHSLDGRSRRFSEWGLSSRGRFVGADGIEFPPTVEPIPTLKSVLEVDVAPHYDLTDATIPRLADSTFVDSFWDGVQLMWNQEGGRRMGYTIYGVEGLAPTLTCTTSRHYERYQIGDRYRRLTPVEYARLQGFPDDHCDVVALKDRYRLFGNAIPPALAAWAIGRLAGESTVVTPRATLF